MLPELLQPLPPLAESGEADRRPTHSGPGAQGIFFSSFFLFFEPVIPKRLDSHA